MIWGPDGHGCSHDTIHLDDNLYLFHLKWFDDQFHVNRHKERLKLRFKDDNGEEVIVGAGSWSWSEMTYQLVTNSFLRFTEDKWNEGFTFDRQRDRITSSYSGNDKGMYSINWFVDGDLRELPARFANVI